MSVAIKEVRGKRELKTFINFTEKLYRECEYYVPQLFFDQLNTLSPDRNPASEFCDSALYLAYKDGALVGRVAAIVNRKANGQWNHNEVRFGWLDFTDDREVSEALIDKGLYDFTILPDSMAEKYMGFYLKVIDPEYLSFLKKKGANLWLSA